MTQQSTGHGPGAADRARVGDWLVVPGPVNERQWRWGRIVGRLPGDGPTRYLIRWLGDDHDSVVLPPPDARVESAADWSRPPGGAIGVWPE